MARRKLNTVAWANKYKREASSVRVYSMAGEPKTRITKAHVKKGRLSEQGVTHAVVAQVLDAPDKSLIGTFEHLLLRPYGALRP